MTKIKISSDFLPLSSYEIVSNDDPTLETISLTLFVAGCPRRCKNCHNESLQTVTEKNCQIVSLEKIKKLILSKKILVKSIVFCGGDFLPFYEKQLETLVDFCKKENLKTILYTGETYENIKEKLKNKIDIIISEPFEYSLFSQNTFPASSNQKVWINQ